MKKYISTCSKCHKKTTHIISKSSRSKGVRLRCVSCGYEKLRWTNFKLLEESKEKLIKLEDVNDGLS